MNIFIFSIFLIYNIFILFEFSFIKMPGTSCRDAIKAWEAKTGQVAAEAKEVSLICQIPFIDKMDNALDTLE